MSDLVQQNITFLRQALELLVDLPDNAYRKIMPPYFSSSMGKHIRHIVDYFGCFLSGALEGRIDYDARKRDNRTETDRHYAISRIVSSIGYLSRLSDEQLSQPVLVHQNETGESSSDWYQSSIGRELQSLVSHTVHHYAVIALMLRIQGFDCPATFGIAPSTLIYERTLALQR